MPPHFPLPVFSAARESMHSRIIIITKSLKKNIFIIENRCIAERAFQSGNSQGLFLV